MRAMKGFGQLLVVIAAVLLAIAICNNGSSPEEQRPDSEISVRATVPVTERPAEVEGGSPTLKATPATRVPQVQVAYSSINVRGGPGMEHEPIAYLYQDDVVVVVDSSSDSSWILVKLPDGSEGWVARSVVSPVGGSELEANVRPSPSLGGESSSSMPQLRVNVGRANLRSGPGTNYDVVGTLERDRVVRIIAKNSGGTWFNVRLADGDLTPISWTPR